MSVKCRVKDHGHSRDFDPKMGGGGGDGVGSVCLVQATVIRIKLLAPIHDFGPKLCVWGGGGGGDGKAQGLAPQWTFTWHLTVLVNKNVRVNTNEHDSGVHFLMLS